MTQYPQINLNGTNGQTLRDEAFAAYEAVNEALIKLREMTVHGRDYQTLKGNPFCMAQNEHFKRVEALRNVSEELEGLIINLDEQIAQRAHKSQVSEDGDGARRGSEWS